MNKRPISARLATIAAILLFAAGAVSHTYGQTGWSQNVSPLPSPTGMVNDYAGVIDAGTKQALETKLRAFKEKTGVELAVAVVGTTGDRDIFDYSMAVARGWGIGSKADDNPGALLFIAVEDRKYFTQISKDLEDEMPDGVAGSLQRQFLVPEFKKQNYGKGISDTIDAYISTIERSLSGSPPVPAPIEDASDAGSYSTFCCLAVILFIILLVWSNRSSKGGGGRGGGDGGGLASALPWIIMSGIGNSSSDSSWGSSSSGWGSSGGSDWGGFGGGGDFGGGGAGGGW